MHTSRLHVDVHRCICVSIRFIPSLMLGSKHRCLYGKTRNEIQENRELEPRWRCLSKNNRAYGRLDELEQSTCHSRDRVGDAFETRIGVSGQGHFFSFDMTSLREAIIKYAIYICYTSVPLHFYLHRMLHFNLAFNTVVFLLAEGHTSAPSSNKNVHSASAFL